MKKTILIVCLTATLALFAAEKITGDYNSTLGYLAGQNATGDRVTAMGAGAAGASKDNVKSTFFGAAAGAYSSNIVNSVAIGYHALKGASNVTDSVIIGGNPALPDGYTMNGVTYLNGHFYANPEEHHFGIGLDANMVTNYNSAAIYGTSYMTPFGVFLAYPANIEWLDNTDKTFFGANACVSREKGVAFGNYAFAETIASTVIGANAHAGADQYQVAIGAGVEAQGDEDTFSISSAHPSRFYFNAKREGHYLKPLYPGGAKTLDYFLSPALVATTNTTIPILGRHTYLYKVPTGGITNAITLVTTDKKTLRYVSDYQYDFDPAYRTDGAVGQFRVIIDCTHSETAPTLRLSMFDDTSSNFYLLTTDGADLSITPSATTVFDFTQYDDGINHGPNWWIVEKKIMKWYVYQQTSN